MPCGNTKEQDVTRAQWRRPLVALLVLSGVLLEAPAGASPTLPPAPTGVTATPGVGSVTVSWTPLSGTGITYAVSASPPGPTCSVVDASSCAIPVTSSAVRQYRVTSSTGAGTSVPSALTAAVPTRLVLITAGQSNATGWESYAVDPKTGIDYLAAPFTNGADAADLITWMPWGIRKGLGATPVPLDTPQPKSPTQAIFGPELGLARQLWADRQVPLTIIKAPCPGTSLAVNWNPAVTTGHPPDALYMRLVAKVLATLAADAHAGTLDVLGGVYWFQGESDIKNAANAASYQGNLATLIGRLRNDLPLAPSAPIALAKVDQTGFINYRSHHGRPDPARIDALRLGNTEVRAADDWAAATLPGVVVVDSADLARRGSAKVHLSNRSELTLGQRLAVATEAQLP